MTNAASRAALCRAAAASSGSTMPPIANWLINARTASTGPGRLFRTRRNGVRENGMTDRGLPRWRLATSMRQPVIRAGSQFESMSMPLSPSDTAMTAGIAHVIQVALTPVFLLSGIGTLLNVFNTRLSRVADHAEHIADLLKAEQDPAAARKLFTHLRRLHRRRSVLDTSILFGALGGAATCGAAFTLFVVTARDATAGWVLFSLFGAALGFTVAALMAFLIDGVFGWHGIRVEGPLPPAKKGV